MQNNKRKFKLIEKLNESDNIVSLLFQTSDNKKYKFTAGQYVDIKPTAISGHGKSYTIASAPGEKLIKLTIKSKGAVSCALIDLEIGAELELEGPYGNFYPEKEMKDVVMFAGGVGITPFYSVLKNKFESKDKSKTLLFYSNKTKSDITFFKELNLMAKNNQNLKIIYCLTQEIKPVKQIDEYTRINKTIINKHVALGGDKCYYVCGSIGFVNDIWKMLKELGVLEENIYTESFY